MGGERAGERQVLERDVTALAAMTRDSAGPGERASAAWVAGRLAQCGAQDVRIETFRYQPGYAGAHALHAAAGLAAGRLRGVAGAAVALGALVSLELEASGRRQWARALLPRREGANVVARVPATGEAHATILLVAHHDAAHTGLAWRRELIEAGARRRLRTRRITPALAPTALGLLATAAGALLGSRRMSRARHALLTAGDVLLGVTLVALADIARSPTVPGASDNATGVAALLAITAGAASRPLKGVELIALAPGCEESGMGGMAAFLDAHGARLDPARTLVLGLDTLGAGQPIVCTGEATLLEHRYAERDVALCEAGARRAGVDPPHRWRIGTWTDPVLARFAGLRAISLLSVGADGVFTNYHRMSDTPENIDWQSVEHCVEIARGVLAEVEQSGL